MSKFCWLQILVASYWHLAFSCLNTEFTCESGQCIDGARFCDGTTDCADGTDEHHGCTNCNRTYYGLSGVKYPIRLNDPVRQTGSVCTLSFIAAGGIYGDLVEITFLSFHIGVYQLESGVCFRGYMEVEDSHLYPPRKRSVRFLRGPKKKQSGRRKDSWERASSSGSFCGRMIGKSATFYSSGDKVNLNVFVSSLVSGHSAAPRLYLTYRFLRRESLILTNPLLQNATRIGCDIKLTNCHSTTCTIKSPNYPGFYLRNLTCRYWVHQDTAPSGYIAQVEVHQFNEFKINILSGQTSNDRFKSGTLTSDCAGDVIRIYDGRTTQSPLLTEFCGSGSLPIIRSSGPDLLVELKSVPFQPLVSSRFELDVRIHFVPVTIFRVVSDKCSVNIDGGRIPTGTIALPDHSMPANATCTFRIAGRKPSDKIWLYFVKYTVPDLHPWTDREHCDVARLRIIYPKLKFRHLHHRYPSQMDHISKNATFLPSEGTFCEKTSPYQCGHASDFEDFVPDRPCSVATESYLSTGPELLLELQFLKAMAILGERPHFVARYEIVEVDQATTPESCSVQIRSTEGSHGWIENPRNLFLYGRGGATNLRCRYSLVGEENEKVRILIQKVNFHDVDCSTKFNATTQRYHCAFTSQNLKTAVINVTEVWNDLELFVGCVCDDYAQNGKVITLESLGNQVYFNLEVQNMGPRDDFKAFHFEVTYEFVPATGCDASDYVMTGAEGHLTMRAQDKTRCRWLLVSLPSRALYVTLRGHRFEDHSCQNKYLFYNVDHRVPFAVFCASGGREHESLFTNSWFQKPEDRQPHSGLTVLEVIADQSSVFSVHWIEVSRRSTTCDLECPELEACISSDLACDGTKHCPLSGSDEAPDKCVQYPVMTIVLSATTSLVVGFVLCLLVILLRQRHLSKREKSAVTHLAPPPPPKMCKVHHSKDFPMSMNGPVV